QKTIAYAPKINHDRNMSEELKEIYKALEKRYVHEGRTIDTTLYQDMTQESLEKFNRIGFECLLNLDEEICPRENAYVAIGNRDHVQSSIALMLYCLEVGRPYNLTYFIVRKWTTLEIEMIKFYHMAKQPKRPPPKKSRNVGKSNRAQFPSSSSSESAPSDNGDLPSTKLTPRSYHRALPTHTKMSNDQREIRGMFKNMARVMHNFEKQLKKGCR
ncbi:hypothetical protein Tco_0036328, partial [Tanacetum coccineum]